jgi:hypothetical protein
VPYIRYNYFLEAPQKSLFLHYLILDHHSST